MQRRGNVVYTDRAGNTVRLVTDEDTLTIAINDAASFTASAVVEERPEDPVRAIAADLESWADQRFAVRLQRGQE